MFSGLIRPLPAVAALTIPQETMDAVLEDWTTAKIPERMRAALRLLEVSTNRPTEIDAKLLTRLRTDGLDQRGMEIAANIGVQFNFINRVADAFDFAVADPVGKARLASILSTVGRFARGSDAKVPWARGDDGQLRPPELEAGRTRLFEAPGDTSIALRRSVEAHVAKLRGGHRGDPSPVPSHYEKYLKKLALNAYKIVDQDLEDLKSAGESKDAIYEVTMVGAFGASLVGIEALYAALYN